jgi:hypothetical protein
LVGERACRRFSYELLSGFLSSSDKLMTLWASVVQVREVQEDFTGKAYRWQSNALLALQEVSVR